MTDSARRDIGRYTLLPEWVARRGLSDRAFRLYVELGFHADYTTGECSPTHETLAAGIGKSTDTVARAQAELVAADVIDVEAQFTGDGDRRANLYTVFTVDPRCPVRTPRKSAGTSPQMGTRTPRKSAGTSSPLLNEKDAAVESTARAAERLRTEHMAHVAELDLEPAATDPLARVREARELLHKPVENIVDNRL